VEVKAVACSPPAPNRLVCPIHGRMPVIPARRLGRGLLAPADGPGLRAPGAVSGAAGWDPQGWEALPLGASFHQLILPRTVEDRPEPTHGSVRKPVLLRPDNAHPAAHARRHYRTIAATCWCVCHPPSPARRALVPLDSCRLLDTPATWPGPRLGASYPPVGTGDARLPSGSGISHRWWVTTKRSAGDGLWSPCCAGACCGGGYLAEERRHNGQVVMGAVAAICCWGSPPACCDRARNGGAKPGSFSSSQISLVWSCPIKLAAEKPFAGYWSWICVVSTTFRLRHNHNSRLRPMCAHHADRRSPASASG